MYYLQEGAVPDRSIRACLQSAQRYLERSIDDELSTFRSFKGPAKEIQKMDKLTVQQFSGVFSGLFFILIAFFEFLFGMSPEN